MTKLHFFLSAYLLPCLLLTAGLSACVNDPAEVAALREKIDTEVETARGVRILYSDSAKVRLIINAPTMLNYATVGSQQQEFPDGLHVTFIDEKQDTSSTLIANWGVYERQDNKITVRDSVVWQSADRQRLETEELIYEDKTERIHTNKFVVLSQPDYVIYGYGLEADKDFENAKVLQVDGRVPVNRPEQ